eukprot:CAMPEP_0184671244 /NCGR_PEP_ID=MMETSP0308-20130426/85381_1 /TAXON_ID=38269 /ORGANISM="Gloeochaete witrockiana, Strain SAG 46.84" /LENGTH=532 /DNA_ID=CAMNT_0027118329 /DNA_START=109 /DNA_END=1704 /DNA_ORIENTATION=+
MHDAIYRSPLPDVTLPALSVGVTEFVFARAKKTPEKTALIDSTSGQALTFSDVDRLIRCVGSGLLRIGLRKGEVVALYAPNCIEYPVIFHAVASIGGVLTTANPLSTAEELASQLRDSNARFLISSKLIIDKALKASHSSRVEQVFCLGVSAAEAQQMGSGAQAFAALWEDDGSCFLPASINAEADLCVLPYSSGTTGGPKGVELTHRNLIANVAQTTDSKMVPFGESDVVLGLLPFFHIYGMQCIMNGVLRNCSTIVVMGKFEALELLRVLQTYSVTVAFLVPPIILFLAKHPLVSKFSLPNLRFIMSGAAPLGDDLARATQTRLNCTVRQGYGMTELSPVSHILPLERKHNLGSIGILVPNTLAKIVDVSSGQSLGPDQVGELCIKGPQVMRGYLNNLEATEFTLDGDGYLHTGDIAYVGDDGLFFVVDRLKELIKYKGFQVAPAELEALLISHPRISDAAVVPVPDEESGEVPRAFVVRVDPQLSEQEVSEYVSSRAAPYKWLRGGVVFIEAIPKSASGKVLRRQLRDW